jgi:phosphoglycerate kinase
MRSIREASGLSGKTVLVRVDFNVENAVDTLRLERSLPTMRFLKEQGARVLLISHRGRPAGKVVPELSLDFALPFLKEQLQQEVPLLTGFDFPALKVQLSGVAPGSVAMLENIRFAAGEEAKDPAFAAGLASLGDVYVNDCFAVDHHASVSVSVLPSLLPAYAGLLVEEELGHLSRVMQSPAQPLAVVVGGGKADDKFDVIENLYGATQTFLVGGVLANTFLKARGEAIDGSSVDDALLERVRKYLDDPKIVLPLDWVKAEDGRIADVGPQTAQRFSALLQGAKTVIWNGPLGIFEQPHFRKGTRAVADAISQSGAFSVVGGGETTQFILEEKMQDKFSFLSTGGGAMLAFLAGKKLPGLEALK